MAPKVKPKTIEETYKKMSQREHVLHRPGMYIGSIDKTVEELWVFDDQTSRMKKKMVEFTPGFLKIFDEVLTNALDHSNRDSTLDKIKVDFDTTTGEISVYNTGVGIPVVIHKEHNMYVPELIFGQLLSSSNYDDNDNRTGAGVNGVGVKCSSIYSKRFVVETVDSVNKLKFVQEYTENMSVIGKPKVTKNSSASYTKVTFLPDYARFKMSGLEKDSISLIKKRVYDCIACTNKNVSIFLNGERIKGRGLLDYSKYFFTDDENLKLISESTVQKVGDTELTWEYIVVPSEHYEQVSFVNGNSTYAGGKHVDHIMYQIINKLKTLLETKKKLKDVKPAYIKERMFLFLRATVINPQFSSQTKEFLTTQVKDFKCKIEVSDKFIDRLWKSSIIDDIVQHCKMKESLDLAKSTDGKKKNKIFVPKLEDALWAGTARSDQCTLILTEGDSAKTFALWGRSVVGPERFAVYPLKGKCLNVRDATMQQLMNNEEINNLKQIIGLKQGKVYNDTSELRYGKVMCLTDADVDGSHIKGLLVNFFHYWWPSLTKLNFIQSLRTPIVKAIRGKNVLEFFTEQDYAKWKASGVNTSGYEIRYFKGLGTSKKEDAKDIFKRFDQLKIDYFHKDEKCDEAILLAFEKDKNVAKKSTKTDAEAEGNSSGSAEVEDGSEAEGNTGVTEGTVIKCSDKRKRWLGAYNKDSYINTNEGRVSFQDFINKELIHFSIYDNLRSIPSLCDGLKPSQRKILHYMLKRNITRSIKVAQLSGYVSAETSYHHGEASLQQAIIGMAQNFVGSNNLNLLVPDGNHGSRLANGKDAASPRYIFTKLSPETTILFNSDDTPNLNMLEDDGMTIEPEWFLPIIPLVLVNGCEGIGTGYSTFIPPHNPKSIIENIIRVLNDEQPLPMKPYYRGFLGEVVQTGEMSWCSKGKWNKLSDTQISITELPVGTGVTTYKEFLESLIEQTSSSSKKDTATKGAKTKRKSGVTLKDVQNKTIDENTGINFLVQFASAADLDKLIRNNTLEKELKLQKSFTTSNMYLFDDNLTPVKYKSTTDILLDFCDIRLEYYVKRREYLLARLRRELMFLEAKVRFIEEYISGTIVLNRKTKSYILETLRTRKYPSQSIDTIEQKNENTSESNNDSNNESTESNSDYDYLIKMPIVSLTQEKIAQLQQQTNSKRLQLEDLQNKNEKDLWREDLTKLLTFIE